MSKPSVIFTFSIDTEEEWLWMDAFPQTDFSVENVNALPKFNRFLRGLGIKPTYFVDYAVANNNQASDILRSIYQAGGSEIGAHLHPWCNPPYFGETTEKESHIVNLPREQVAQKLDVLNAVINQNIGVAPTSFRSGRWGINGEILALLASRGYRADSSVYPFYENEFFSCQGSPLTPYWPCYRNSLIEGEQREIMEIPVCAGFNRTNFEKCEKLHQILSQPAVAWTRIIGLLWYTKLLRKIYLSPELTAASDMNRLIDKALQNEQPVIHMYIHSSSLIDGATGLIDVKNAYNVICERIKNTVTHLEQRANVKYCTITQAANAMKAASTYPTTLTWKAALI